MAETEKPKEEEKEPKPFLPEKEKAVELEEYKQV